MTLIRLATLCCLILCAPGALAGRVEIPLRVPFEPLRQALSAQLAASPTRPNVIYREGPCRYLNLETPKLDAVDGQLRLVGPGSAALGVDLFGNCRNAAVWRGSVQFTLAPHLDKAGRLRLRIVDSKLTDENGESTFGFIWELSKRYLHPRLERFSYDVGASRAMLLSIVRSAAPPEHGAALELALRQLQVLDPRVEPNDVVVPIAMDFPDAWLTAPPAPAAAAAPLTEAELEALDKALQPWDAFLAYSIKQVALDSPDNALRKRLFTLLLESRYQLVAILAGEAPAGGDPVRALFIDAWSELRAILADARYTLFLDAGDALMALDQAAPGLGMTLSADGLRQLARSLRPGARGDPLAYDWAVDPQLRRLFDVEDIPEPEPAPAPRSWLDFFVTSAYAAVQSLDRWVPARDELDAYEERIGELLKKTSATALQRADLAAPYDEIYRNLVPTTALIESCWRQYVLRGGKVSYLRSAVGSVGIMQINQRVWRGFYDVERLRWNTAYNTRAGAQILLRYMKDYAMPYAERTGDLKHIPRATYAVYNAGPRAVGRFNKARRHPREARVDDKLWTLYEGIASGGRADLSTCAVTTAAASQ
ncbi:MAG: lytic transglycosylase domain-containing protein [Betaproteobacteria bacterium]|nr:MAG: lytic transglycosylase domain-containing protein [Betaproteobacteria bacterium]